MVHKRIYFSLKSVILLLFFISMIIQSSVVIKSAPKDEYFFQIRILGRSDTPTINIPNLLAQELKKIRIGSQVISYPGGAFESVVLSKGFDIVLLDMEWPNSDVDPTFLFSEIGAANYWGLDTQMTGGEENENYLSSGIIEIDSDLRTSIYYNWQENLMDNLLPIIPLFNPITTYVSRDILDGWDHENGIIASLPYMEWSAPPPERGENVSIFIDYTDEWDILNPLFIEDDFYISLISEPLIRIDKNFNPVGILAKSWNFNSNYTKLTINLRENVFWQPDIDNLYINEPFDADDVLFSIKMYKEVSNIGTFFKWIKNIEKENATTIHIYIDGNSALDGLQPYAPVLSELTKLILPEHYLNVSVGENGLPNTSSENWNNYGASGLGTGMYYLKEYLEGVQATLNYNENWWGSEPSGYNEDLDIKEYQVRFLTDLNIKMLEFEAGRLDVFKDYKNYMDEYKSAPFQLQSTYEFDVTYIGFNLKSTYCPEIGDLTLCEDGTMSKGLAVRKAIAHLIDKSIIKGLLDIEVEIMDSPFSNKFSSYISSNIIKYTPNVDESKEYMLKAGFNPLTLTSPGFSFRNTLTSIISITVLIFAFKISKKSK